MRYFVTLEPSSDSRPLAVDILELPSGALEVNLEGRAVDLDVVSIGGQLSVRVDGKVVDLTVEGALPELGASASGHRGQVRVESERMRAADSARKGSAGGAERVIKSPMPGRVVKVLVAKGDSVQTGQGLLVLEAMKMENEVKTKTAGTVAEVHVKAGSAVEGNAKLVTLA
jgi:glutaconyl-CoA/methylmalonyl-CoA decarboxylase subunit gamma